MGKLDPIHHYPIEKLWTDDKIFCRESLPKQFNCDVSEEWLVNFPNLKGHLKQYNKAIWQWYVYFYVQTQHIH